MCHAKLLDPACQYQFTKHMWRLNVDIACSIDEHLQLLCDHLREGMKVFSATVSTPRQSWISVESWKQIQLVRSLRKSSRYALEWAHAARCRHIFLAWVSSTSLPCARAQPSCDLDKAEKTTLAHYRFWALASRNLYLHLSVKRRSVFNDRNEHLERITEQAEQAAAHGDNKLLYSLSKRMVKFEPRSLKSVKRLDGKLTCTPQEYDERFFEHFQKVFEANRVKSLRDLGIEEPMKEFDPPLVSPSICRTERAISNLGNCKAIGPDSIPAEVLKAGRGAVAVKLKELLDRVWSKGYWPLAWRGGRLVELLKKGSANDCDNHRGLLTADHLSKAAAAILDDSIEPGYMEYIPAEQCGATRGRGTDLATHMVRTAIDVGRLMHLSVAIIFIDLTKAFDFVLREIVIGWAHTTSNDRVDDLCSLGLTPEQAQVIMKEINEDGSVLEQMHVHPLIRNLVASLHTGTWFTHSGSEDVLHVRRGGRQGCRFGGRIFNLAYAFALKRVRKRISEQGILLVLNFPACRPFWCDGDDVQPVGDITHTPVMEATFVDDEALLLFARSPSTLESHIDFVLSVVVDEFERCNMNVNWKKGKTELILHFRGKHSKQHKDAVAQGDGESSLLLPSLQKHISVVESYKHLGSVVCRDGSVFLDAKSRSASAMASFAPLASKLLSSKSVSVRRKISLGWSLIVSKLVYNVHVWPVLLGPSRRLLNNVYMRLWRRIADRARFKAGSSSDVEVRRSLGVVSLDCLVRKRRLKYLGRLLRAGIPALTAMLSVRGQAGKPTWVDTITSDLCVLQAALPNIFEHMSSPRNDPNSWFRLVRDFPKEWNAIVDQYNEVRDDLQVSIDNAGPFGKVTTSVGESKVSSACMMYVCPKCVGVAFEDSKKLGMHMRVKHSMRSSFVSFVPDTSLCPICKTDFQSRLRLLTHLGEKRVRSKARGISCQKAFMNSNPAPVDTCLLEELNARDAAARKVARQAGRTHELAFVSARRTTSHILTGALRNNTNSSRQTPRFRLLAKTPASQVKWKPLSGPIDLSGSFVAIHNLETEALMGGRGKKRARVAGVSH